MRALVAVVAFVAAASPVAAMGSQGNPVDQQFLDEAYSFYRVQIDLGALAEQRAATLDVRALGERMVREQTVELLRLSDIAEKDHLAATAILQDSDVVAYKRLDRLRGGELDAAYVAFVAARTDAAISAAEREAAHGENRDLRAHAERVLPALRAQRAAAADAAGR